MFAQIKHLLAPLLFLTFFFVGVKNGVTGGLLAGDLGGLTNDPLGALTSDTTYFFFLYMLPT